jgi:hypothetical protein
MEIVTTLLPSVSDFEIARTPPCPSNFASPGAADRRTHAEIGVRAQSIWECKNRPDNSQLADWLEAEAEVLGEA